MVNRFRNEKGVFLFDVAIIIAVVFLALLRQPQSLRDYEQLCRETTDPPKKEEIALAAVDFLVSQSIPESIACQIAHATADQNLYLAADTLLFPEPLAAINDSLAGWYDGLLIQNLPKLYWMRRNKPDSVLNENFSAARKIAAQLEAWLDYSYWTPLMDFLDKANDEAWQRWLTAPKRIAAAKQYTRESQYALAQFAAVYGLQANHNLPDFRQKLDLIYRLQNGMVGGRESLFNIGLALADWITRESSRTGYFLRAVSLQFNCGNQLYRLGRYDEALEKFKIVAQLTQQWRHFQPQDMQWYASESLERIAAVHYYLGDYSEMLNYLDRYGKLAKDTRQKTLYHINRGMAARLVGDLQVAEEELRTAIACGKGDKKKNIESDLLNTWYAYLELGDMYLEYHLPEKALFYFQNAKVYVTLIDENFLAGEKLSDYWLCLAEAFVQNQKLDSAVTALEQAKGQTIDSPALQVKSFFCAAQVKEQLGQIREADTLLAQALTLCQNNGMTIYEIDASLRQVALTFKTPKGSPSTEYSTADIENLIARTNKSGAKQQLVHSLALAVEAANRARRYDQARLYADRLLQETEALSRLYDQEQRQVFFQHSTYDRVKAAIALDIRLGKTDSAFIKLDYVKLRALRQRLAIQQKFQAASARRPYTDLANLQQLLQPEEAIINYMVTEDTLYAFVLTSSHLRMFRAAITRRELQKLVLQYLNKLTPNDHQANDYDERRQQQEFLAALQLSYNLFTYLLKPMAEFIETIKHLYIIPDEFLYSLPFNTLALQEGLTTEFLINRKTVMYLPAASLFSTANSKDLLHPRLLASVDSTMYGASKILKRLGELTSTKVTIRNQWQSQSEIESTLGSDYKTYFFYAHAEANWDDPWQSYIQFPLQSSRLYGKLTYADVDSLHWRDAALVILAGCETTGNRIYNGAGLSGLQRSFFSAGARQVLATFWKVDAGKVAPQMSDFLQEWDRSGDAVLALQKMQKAAIVKLQNDPYIKYPHPRYWGAYNLTGIKTAVHVAPTPAAN